jgi:pimeloyl-ACP methyl ester carboxylesterase
LLDHDQVIPLARSEELARLTGGELAVVRGSGHEPQFRYPDDVNSLLDNFFDECYSASPERLTQVPRLDLDP